MVKGDRKISLIAILFSLPWCCILPAILSLSGLIAGMAAIFTNSAFAHEPIFSLGPETIYKGGVGIETEFEYEENGEKETSVHTEMIYGVTENLSLTLGIPYLIEKEESNETSEGLGEIEFRTKYQLFRKDTLGAQDKIALIYGIKLPTGDEDKTPSLGSGAVDHTFGLSIGHESTTLYGFATGRYKLRTESGGKDKGDKFLFDIAFGARPWLRPYKSWDFVFLLENSYIYSEKDEINGVKQLNTGGEEILIGPTFLWSIRNLMIKGGVQFSVWEDLNGDQEETDYRAKLAVEWHF